MLGQCCTLREIKKAMSTGYEDIEIVSWLNIKCCVICRGEISQVVKCQNTSCDLRVSAEGCKSQLYAYAENGSIKFCYACGGDMDIEDDHIVCSSDTCSDSIKFHVTNKEQLIHSSDGTPEDLQSDVKVTRAYI